MSADNGFVSVKSLFSNSLKAIAFKVRCGIDNQAVSDLLDRIADQMPIDATIKDTAIRGCLFSETDLIAVFDNPHSAIVVMDLFLMDVYNGNNMRLIIRLETCQIIVEAYNRDIAHIGLFMCSERYENV